ncbi:hypothetical protein [Teredinibacter turnerae]|uniref:hypothetical protein n=1 Tax=Teredinibacter turnerae TaxID=2426 RepID=UPI0005F78182|nr:hypothetical protein [Teredinibacter turnerae]
MKYLVLLISLISGPVFSGSGAGKVRIEHIGDWNGKSLLFFYTDSHISAPDCNTYAHRWVIDLSTDEGKAQYSLLLAAQMSDKTVNVGGKANCNLWDNSETVHWVGFAS